MLSRARDGNAGDEPLNCPACAQENRPGAKFCAECGTPFAKVCSSCNSELRPEAKFCDECGTPTAFGLRQAPDSTDGAVRRTVFGIPEVGEDGTLGAIRAWLDLQGEFVSAQQSIAEQCDIEVSLGVGINSGEIVVADDADLMGRVLNTAARLKAVCTSGEVPVGDRSQMADWVRATVASDADLVTESEAWAVRDDRLALVSAWTHCPSSRSSEHGYQVIEVDEHGRLVYGRHWSGDERLEAMHELAERFLELLGPESSSIKQGVLNWYVHEPEDSDDAIKFVDHRPLHLHDERPAELTDMVSPGARSMVQRYVDTRPRAVLAHWTISPSESGFEYYTERSIGPGGEDIERLSLLLHMVEDGLIRRIEAFDVDDLDRAFATFPELTAAAPDAHVPNHRQDVGDDPPVDPELLSGLNRFMAALNSGDVEMLRGVVAPGFTWTHHGKYSGDDFIRGVEEVMETIRVWSELGIVSLEADVVATRGQRLCLTQDVAGGDANVDRAYLIVGEYDAEYLALRMATFDVDQLDEATALLDAWCAESITEPEVVEATETSAEPERAVPEDIDVRPWVERLDGALSSRTWGTYTDLLAADFEHVDHRVGPRSILGRDDALEAERNAATLFGHMNATEVISSAGPIAVRRGDYGPPGARVMPFVCVTEFDANGVAVTTHTFDATGLDDALQLLDGWYEGHQPDS